MLPTEDLLVYVYMLAGHRGRKKASVSALRAATAQVIEDPRYRAAAAAWRPGWLPNATTTSPLTNWNKRPPADAARHSRQARPGPTGRPTNPAQGENPDT